MDRSMGLPGIWKDRYVSRLGILDHCREVITINDEIVRLKNICDSEDHTADLSVIRGHFESECADLFLILTEYLDPLTVEERFKKFQDKAGR